MRIAIEANHQWAQRLGDYRPGRSRGFRLVCITCGQLRAVGEAAEMTCATVLAWQTPNATSDGDRMIQRLRRPVSDRSPVAAISQSETEARDHA